MCDGNMSCGCMNAGSCALKKRGIKRQERAIQPQAMARPFANAFQPSFTSPMQAPFRAAPRMRAQSPYKPLGATDKSLTGGGSSGSDPAPAGLTQSQWDRLTPEQQSDYIKADTAAQKQIRDALINSANSALELIFARIKQEQDRAMTELELERERIRQQAETDRARINADRDAKVAASTGQLPGNLQPQTTTKSGTTSSSSSSGMLLAGGALLLLLAMK